MREFDFSEFEAAIEAHVGLQTDAGPYILERYRYARNYNIPDRTAETLVPKIGSLARKFGLTSAGR